MKIFFITIFLSVNSLLFSQIDVLDNYPPTQHFYEKGELNFLKELQKAAIENNLKPCDNKSEHYQPKWIVFSDHTIKFIKDTDTLNIQKNKCAFDFTKTVFKYLKNWKPVIIKEITYAAIATYDINPSDLLNLKIRDDLKPNFVPAQYHGGDIAFRIGIEKLINPIFDKNHITLNNQVVNIRLKISRIGTVKEVKIYPEIPFRIEDEILNALQHGLKKWEPATMNGITTEQNISISLSFVD